MPYIRQKYIQIFADRCLCVLVWKTHTFVHSKRLTFRSDYENGRQLMVSYLCKVLTIHKICLQFKRFFFLLSSSLSIVNPQSLTYSLSNVSLSRPCRLSLLLSVVALSLLALVLARSPSLSLSLCVVVCFKCKKKILFIRCSVVLCKFVENFFRRSHLYNMKTHRLSFAKRYIHSFVCALLLSVSHTQITTFSVQ